VVESSRLVVDGDLAALMLLSLRNKDAENAVLHRGLDLILVDASREAEGAGELADAALRDPVLRSRLLGFLLLLGDLRVFGGWCSGLSGIVLDSCLVGGCLALSDGASCGGSFDVARGTSSAFIGALGATADVDGLLVDELDLDVLLVNAREFAVEFVGVLELLDIEFGLEGLQSIGAATAGSGVVVEVIQEAEEGCEGGFRNEGGQCGSVEERHLACGGWFKKSSRSVVDDWCS